MKKLFPLLLVVGIALFLLSAVFRSTFMASHDGIWHITRLTNMQEMLSSGQFPVRWSANLDSGYGMPLFNYSYPLPYYIGAILMFLGFKVSTTYNLLLLLAYILGGVGFYFLGKGGWYGVGASLLFLLTPYLFLDFLVRGALGEIFSIAFFPWALIALNHIEEKGKVFWYSPIPLALILLSHNFYGLFITALIMFFILVFYKHKKILLISTLFSFGLSAFFLLPSLLEKGYLSNGLNQFVYKDHWVYPSQLLYSKWNYLGSFPGKDPNDMSFQLGLANWVIVISSLLAALLLKKNRSRVLLLLFCFGFSLFLTLPYSELIWRLFPMLNMIQFPWRFLGIAILILPLLYIEVTNSLSAKKAGLLKLATVFLLILGFYNVRNYRRPFEWYDQERFATEQDLYRSSTTVIARDELVPKWAVANRQFNSPGLVMFNDTKVEGVKDNPLELDFSINSSSSGEAIIARNFFPMWQGRVDGNKLTLSPGPTGEISMPVLSGQHSYKLFVQSTLIERLSNLITLVSIAGIMVLWRRSG